MDSMCVKQQKQQQTTKDMNLFWACIQKREYKFVKTIILKRTYTK